PTPSPRDQRPRRAGRRAQPCAESLLPAACARATKVPNSSLPFASPAPKPSTNVQGLEPDRPRRRMHYSAQMHLGHFTATVAVMLGILNSKYELIELAGEGGLAHVFRANPLGAEGFRRPVAVKRI